MGNSQRRLADILSGRNLEDLARQFEGAEPAAEYSPVPAGTYEVDFIHGELCSSQTGSTGYVCQFVIAKGEHQGRRLWHTFWLSERAIPYSKRDMEKLGITSLKQCEEPVRPGVYCMVNVVVRTDDGGTPRNRINKIEVGGLRDDPMGDPDFGSFPRTDRTEGGQK